MMTIEEKPWNVPSAPLDAGSPATEDVKTGDYSVPVYEPVAVASHEPERSVCYLVSEGFLGSTDKNHGDKLMQDFWNALAKSALYPDYVILVNGAAYLALEDSPILDALLELYGGKTNILVAQESLEFYGLEGRQAVGRTGTMSEIAGIVHSCDKVVTF